MTLRHFLSLADYSSPEIQGLLNLAQKVKANPQDFAHAPSGHKLALIFEKPSTRTRVSFQAGILELGGHGLFVSSRDLQLGRGETVMDTAQVLSRYVSGIMARVFAHKTLEDLATGTIPVINGLSDLLHPCQALADLQTLQEHMGTLNGAVLAYVGDGNNVAHSLIHACGRAGVRLRMGCPPGYAPDPKILETARSWGGDIQVMQDPRQAVDGADAVYTDVWTSMGQEAENKTRLKDLAGYQVNAALFALAKDDAIFLHCLPAHRGEEVTDDIVDHPQSRVFDQAENRLHAQKAVMLHLMAGSPLEG
jgi:ornithine carbamoyltransferase